MNLYNKTTKVGVMLLLLMLSSLSVMAAPARPKAVTVIQPDGTSLTFFMRGDELAHWMQTADGALLMQGEDKAYYYAERNADGLMVCSGMLAHNQADRTEAEQASVEELKAFSAQSIGNVLQAAKPLRAQQRAQVAESARSVSRIDGIRGKKVTGKMNVLVILAEFADKGMSVDNPQSFFSDQYNKSGFDLYGHMGSVRDYFLDQSYGQLDVSFDVAGPVKVSQKYSYYGKNNAYGSDKHAGQMICEACKLVDSEVDFSKYDNDGDGYVDQVYVIYAGYDEAEGGGSDCIWGHQHDLYTRKRYYSDGDGIMRLDGVKVNKYACSSELSGYEGYVPEPIGTFCHEFSHCLGLMDTYDVDYSGCFGMQGLDLMASGMYNGPQAMGEVPCGYTAYERWYLGWLDLVELDSPACVRNMPSLDDKPVAYVIHNGRTPSEFFTLENRQNSGWFSYVLNSTACHGMLITHVDYDASAWTNNEINNTKNHQRMSYVPADNNYGSLYQYSGSYYYDVSEDNYRGDFFPGLYDVTEFTDDSHASCGGKLFNLNSDGSRRLGKPVTNISEDGGLISFDCNGGDNNYVIDGISGVASVSEGTATFFDVSGHRVKSMAAPGLYVVKQAGTARKVLVK